MVTDRSRQLGQESVLTQIETAMASPLWNERLAAIDLVAGLLADLPSERTVERLIEILDRLARDTKWEVRRAVAPALVAARRPAARSVVDRLTEDDHPWVRQAAQRAKRKLSRVTSPADKQDPRAHFAFEAIRDLDGRSAAKAYQAAMRIGERYYEELAADTAHELNTYRTAIEGLVEELEVRIKAGREILPGVLDILQRIRDRSGFFKALVDGLLAFTRDTELPFEVEALEPIVKEAMVLARDKTAAALVDRRVETVVKVPEALALETRKARLHQALVNILSNAFESLAGTEGQARVTIEAESNGSDRLRLTIADTGVGMEADQVENATKRFSSLKRDKGGIGLGLPLAVKIVEEHGGRLEIDSAPGEGTSVTIELPLRQGRA